MMKSIHQAGALLRSRAFGIRIAALFAALLMAATLGAAQSTSDSPPAGTKLKAAHELTDPAANTDEYGLTVGVPISFPARRYPAYDEFPTGPDVGERLPDFKLTNQNGELIDFHESRDGGRAAVVFHRSVVW